MLLDAMMLHPHTSKQRGGGCGMRLFGAASNIVIGVYFARENEGIHLNLSVFVQMVDYYEREEVTISCYPCKVFMYTISHSCLSNIYNSPNNSFAVG